MRLGGGRLLAKHPRGAKLDRKILAVFTGALIAVLVSSGFAISIHITTVAKNFKDFVLNSNLSYFDFLRIRYFSKEDKIANFSPQYLSAYGLNGYSKNTKINYARIGDVTWNRNNDSTHPNYKNNKITYWQPFSEEYGLGYVAMGESESELISNTCSSDYFYPTGMTYNERYQLGLTRKNSKATLCYFPTSGGKNDWERQRYAENQGIPYLPSTSGYKSEFNFVDHTRSASYMGELYDVRQYAWNVGGTDDASISLVAPKSRTDVTECNFTTGQFVQEFHFYPAGTLDYLHTLKYTVGYTDAEGNSLDTPEGYGVFLDASGNLVFTWEQYLQYLHSKEAEINDNTGVFKGIMRVDDMDSGLQDEGYTPLSGVERVYATFNTNINISSSRGWNRFLGDSAKFSDLCNEEMCRTTWGSSRGVEFSVNDGVDHSHKDDYVAIWLEFTVTPDQPLRFVYHTTHHCSSISSSPAEITYAFVDQPDELSDDLQDYLEEYASEYQKMYKENFDSVVRRVGLHEEYSDRIFRTFRVTQYSIFNPMAINKAPYLEEIIKSHNIKWYTCPELTSDCAVQEVSFDPKDYDSLEKYYETIKDYVVYGNQNYYASWSDSVRGNFDPTCYSGNDSYVDTAEIEKLDRSAQ